MKVRKESWQKVLLLAVATLVAMGAWGVYTGEQALAGTPPDRLGLPHFKCYETSETPLNRPLRLFDQFHPPLFDDEGSKIPEGGEDVTLKGPHLFCTPLIAKCFPEEERCEFFEQDGIGPEQIGPGHLKCYKLAPSGPPVNQTVPVLDQFGEETLKVGTAQFLCAPAFKGVIR